MPADLTKERRSDEDDEREVFVAPGLELDLIGSTHE